MNVFQKGTLLLEEEDVVYLLKEKVGLSNFLNQLHKRLEQGFKHFAAKQITVPPRHEFYFPSGTLISMPAANSNYFTCKIVNTHRKNPFKFNIPTVISSGLLVDAKTGYPIMLTQSTILTALRTGTVSAIATKYLARKNSQTIGIIGNGAQALPQLHAISLIKDIKRVYAYDIDEKASKSFKKSAEKLLKGLEVSIVVDAEIASRESDILVTVTCKEKNTPPVVFNNWIRNGTHINAVGGVFPNEVELEKSLIERAKVIVEFKDHVTYKGEAQYVPKEKIYADLSDIIINIKDARVKNDEVTIFDSVGFAMEDLQTYKLVYELATAEGIGKRVNIAGRPKYSKNLYEPLLS